MSYSFELQLTRMTLNVPAGPCVWHLIMAFQSAYDILIIAEKEDPLSPRFKRPKRAIGHRANFNFFIKILTRRLDCFSPQEDELSNNRGGGNWILEIIVISLPLILLLSSSSSALHVLLSTLAKKLKWQWHTFAVYLIFCTTWNFQCFSISTAWSWGAWSVVMTICR